MGCVFYIPEPLARGYKTHNEFHNIVRNENAFQILLSHDNSKKYQYFMKKVFRILRTYRAKVGLKRRALRNVIMLLLMSLAKERETGVKSVM